MPQVFTAKEKAELTEQMLEAGLALLKEHGMTHTSVEKVTQAVGIGRSTFYNFFPTKEKFIYDIVVRQREKGKRRLTELLDDRERITVVEAKAYLRHMFSGENTVYRYLTNEDEAKLKAALSDEFALDLQYETKVIDNLLVYMEGVRPQIDYPVVTNLMKLLALTQESKELLHESGMARTLDALFELLFAQIFIV